MRQLTIDSVLEDGKAGAICHLCDWLAYGPTHIVVDKAMTHLASEHSSVEVQA